MTVLGVSLVAQMVKNLPAIQETQVQSLGCEDPLEKTMATNPLQYSCLQNPMDRGAWQVIVHGVAKSQTQLRDSHLRLFLQAWTLDQEDGCIPKGSWREAMQRSSGRDEKTKCAWKREKQLEPLKS